MKNKVYISLVFSLLLIAIPLSACRSDTSTDAAPAVVEATSLQPSSPDSIAESDTSSAATVPDTAKDTVTTKPLTISVVNLSDIHIGMFSVIDPVTGQQIDMSSLESGSTISLETNWPVDTQSFQWALYNESGELCIDASTDISSANTAVALLLSGEGTVSNVEVVTE